MIKPPQYSSLYPSVNVSPPVPTVPAVHHKISLKVVACALLALGAAAFTYSLRCKLDVNKQWNCDDHSLASERMMWIQSFFKLR